MSDGHHHHFLLTPSRLFSSPILSLSLSLSLPPPVLDIPPPTHFAAKAASKTVASSAFLHTLVKTEPSPLEVRPAPTMSWAGMTLDSFDVSAWYVPPTRYARPRPRPAPAPLIYAWMLRADTSALHTTLTRFSHTPPTSRLSRTMKLAQSMPWSTCTGRFVAQMSPKRKGRVVVGWTTAARVLYHGKKKGLSPPSLAGPCQRKSGVNSKRVPPAEGGAR